MNAGTLFSVMRSRKAMYSLTYPARLPRGAFIMNTALALPSLRLSSNLGIITDAPSGADLRLISLLRKALAYSMAVSSSSATSPTEIISE